MLFLRIFMPKDFLTWGGAIFVMTTLFLGFRQSIFSFPGILIIIFLLSLIVFAATALPPKVVETIALTPTFIRVLIYSLLAYAVVATLGNISEARSLRSWWEPLTFTGGAPFTGANGLGIFAGMVAALTQRTYRRNQPLVDRLIRGHKLIAHTEAREIAQNQLKPDEPCFIWGGVPLPFWRGDESFVAVGEPGSGKTMTIQILERSVLSSIVPGSNRRSVIYDAKRDIMSILATWKLKCRIKTLHPFDKRGWAWDIAADVPDPMHAIELARILIPEKAGESQPYFPNAARALLSGVMEGFLHAAPGKWNLRDVVLALRYQKRVKHLLKASVHTRYLIEKYVTDKTSDKDVSSTIENSMRRLSFVAAGWEFAGSKKVSLEDWVTKEESVLILGRSPNIESTFTELNRAILFRLTQIIRDQENADRVRGDRARSQTWIFIDELSEAGKLDGFNSLLKEGRSKGACVVLGFQDLHSLEEVYGKHLGKELVGICRNKVFLRTTDPDTQKYASACFGSQDVDIPRFSTTEGSGQTFGKDSSRSESTGGSASSQRVSRPVVLPSQFDVDLPPPTRETGLSAFCLTTAVPEPYFAHLPGEFIEQALPKVDVNKLSEDQLDFVPRFKRGSPDISLKEWTEEDLKRLNLENHPELLETGEDESGPSSGSWAGIIR